ncbi:MAG: nickel pincer cofactor biosynthesis protein LarB [Candidatus Methanoliparum thermophilum]|uniref:Nickel pincer cofactor biosynthesis protein LarB n=1 Tax=Methanoliparum thermophilum TaxID=2491083 RepID=A0A520KTM3_METT2|nr:nickel pincer cofactor biosynthesis protein LarB [Candidatus Methanoliparum sp. LAM-1]RZN65100.1 MAG: nickel pincer cofactor biosynthesis protein LarB [Candidatus Methanoliparum thermophilum]BDC36007.1 hypothetical protein MTLP_06890 [Candidatus Methanoliparum sp. LAM-1]
MRDILEKLQSGKISIENAEKEILNDFFAIQPFASLDIYREERCGIPEIIFAENKPAGIFLHIVEEYMKKKDILLATRLKEEHYKILDDLRNKYELDERKMARSIIIKRKDFRVEDSGRYVGIITAGTSDIHVAEEAKCVLDITGVRSISCHDVGIAGIHRIVEPLKKMQIRKVRCIIVAAGMDGALPSFISGLVKCPVIGVPVSTGYGFGKNGVGALIGMLQSCSPGLAVVNIDAGVNAGAIASLIARGIAYE